MESNRFAPQDNAARAQAATILRNCVAEARACIVKYRQIRYDRVRTDERAR